MCAKFHQAGTKYVALYKEQTYIGIYALYRTLRHLLIIVCINDLCDLLISGKIITFEDDN